MVRSVWVFVTVLCLIEANGFRLFELSLSSEELDDSAIDESDYWDILSGSSRMFDIHDRITEDEKWNQIDNLEFIDDDDDDETVDIVELNQYAEIQATKTYRLGKRVRGDEVIAFSARNQSWPRVQDIRTNLTYPGHGVSGKKVSYIEIQVNQTSTLGKAYVVRGGIGRNLITVIVEAYHTLYFNFKATFYGK